MKKLLAYVQGFTNPTGLYKPVGWLVMPISDACVNVVCNIHDGARLSMTTWRQVYSTISRELVKAPWQPVYKIHLGLMEMVRYEWLILTRAYKGNFT